MESLKRSWEIAKASFKVLGEHKILLVFPMVAGVSTVFIGIFFLSPFLFLHLPDAAGPLGLLGIYFASMFIATFFNVAFVHAIFNAFKGGEVSVSESLSFAVGKLQAIFLWSLLAGIVGFLIRAFEQKLGVIGRLVVGLIGVAWSVAATFAIPAIVISEGANPIDALKLSAATVKKTWGEEIIGFAGLGAMNALVICASLPLLGVAFYLGFVDHFWLGLAVGTLWVAAFLAVAYVFNVATQIYRGALFLYSSEGLVPTGYTQDELHAGGKLRAS